MLLKEKLLSLLPPKQLFQSKLQLPVKKTMLFTASPKIKTRIAEHRGTINNEKLDKSVGVHFNKSGHRLSDFSFSVLEKCYKQCPEYLRKREEHWIQRFQTKFKGLNKIS